MESIQTFLAGFYGGATKANVASPQGVPANALDLIHAGAAFSGASIAAPDPVKSFFDYMNSGPDMTLPEALGNAALGGTAENPVGIPDIGASIAEWVPRLAVIILGMVFVAAGLALFKGPAVEVIKGNA